ncbi:hypothetical protein [Virgibacillus sp. YIM 98842]|uniref:hypothetical protein n=1 Tax=Virgibacillus sp. YIM 98842 TaxID=2663533 RepID=UPI0013DB2353|nr:hypothetical protein [Virgibacillus sp. YIM 98842]
MAEIVKRFKVRHKYRCLFENPEKQEIIYVLYEDLDGYINYEYCDDGTRQVYKMTPVELFRNYERIWD